MSHTRSSRHVPERFLRQLWKHQEFQTSHLHTIDGKPVKIFSTGTLNGDGGPDFSDAQIRIDDRVFLGDVEIHQHNEEWEQHAHHLDPKYNRVILHVVLSADTTFQPLYTESKRAIPVLALGQHLQDSYHANWQSMITHERAERNSTIKCHAQNSTVDSSTIMKWLRKLAIERVELKVRRFEERLKEMIERRRLSVSEAPPRYDEIPFGINPEDLPPPVTAYSARDFSPVHLWKQLLYEGVMQALGYSKNQEPMSRLAQNMTLQNVEKLLPRQPGKNGTAMKIEALLFGAAGLLPVAKQIKDLQSKTRVRHLHAIWRSAGQEYRSGVLSPVDWQFFRLRPENFPTVRLAGAARLVANFLSPDSFKTIIQIVKDTESLPREKFSALESLFIVPADTFWKTHYLFEERSDSGPTVCIGKQRADEIVLNVVIPICLLYARIFKDKEARAGALSVFENFPSLSENSVTNIIEEQLIKEKFKLASSMMQQGAIQLYKHYCEEKRCAECMIGKKVFTTSQV